MADGVHDWIASIHLPHPIQQNSLLPHF